MNPLPLILVLTMQADVMRLGHDSYPIREQGSRNLQAWMPLSVGHVRAACQSRDPEVARRAEVILEEFARTNKAYFRARASQLRCAGYKLVPWIDSLPSDYPDRQNLVWTYVSRAKDQQEIPINLGQRFDEYRVATILFTADLLRSGRSEEEVLTLYRRMADQEVEWLQRHRAVWGEVLTEATARD